MKRLIAFFVVRPLLVNLLLVFVIVGGLLATRFMNYQMMPKVDLGLVNITTLRPGAGFSTCRRCSTASYWLRSAIAT